PVRAGHSAADGSLPTPAPAGAPMSVAVAPLPARRAQRLPAAGLVFAIALVAFMAIVPPVVGGYVVQALTSYLISGMLALAVGLITGYGRLFNLGVGANFGVSAYTVAILTHHGVTNPFLVLAIALLMGVLV